MSGLIGRLRERVSWLEAKHEYTTADDYTKAADALTRLLEYARHRGDCPLSWYKEVPASKCQCGLKELTEEIKGG